MILIFVIVVGVIIGVFYMNPTSQVLQRDVEQASIIADQMMIYHSAASQACARSCPANNSLDPTPLLSSARQGKGAFNRNSVFRSVATDSVVFTFYTRAGGDQAQREFHGRVLSEIIGSNERDTGSWVGLYDLRTQSLKLKSNSVWFNQETGKTESAKPVEYSLIAPGLPPIADGSPVIVSRK